MFTIIRATVFDGVSLLDGVHDVVVDDGVVQEVRPASAAPSSGASVVDAAGATLLPGLIDSHVHASLEGLEQSARFGVTTVLDMGSPPEVIAELRIAAATRHDVADLRSAITGLTHPDGHPHQMIGDLGNPATPTVRSAAEVPAFVDDRVAEGVDYLKTWLEDGRVLGQPVTLLDPSILDAFVAAGHEHGLNVLVHALTRDTTRAAVAAGADGLTHLFLDEPHTDDLVAAIRDAKVHVVPTLSLLASLAGEPAAASLADDARVQANIPVAMQENLRLTWSTLTPEHFEMALASTAALHSAGVPVLAGTDAGPFPVPGLSYGASLHAELQLLTRAGLSPLAALAAATSVPAERFGLSDRGRVASGLRADLVLVDGDPAHRMEDTLALRAVWRGGVAIRD